MEGVVHSGWLVKSPPERRIVKAKWRQRWFMLRHSGLLPGQFILEYFIDNTCKKLKGRIDLDQCEQVDAGLTFESKKTSYQYMFDIRTPKRTYYLVAETEAEMNKWVECICSVCGLKIHIEEDYFVPQEPAASTNLTEATSTSNPYIPISECHTGKPVLNGNFASAESLNDLLKKPPPPPPLLTPLSQWNSLDHVAVPDEFYDHPKPLKQSNMVLDAENCDIRSDLESLNDVFSTSKANWNISLEDSVPVNSSTVPRRKLCTKPEYDVPPQFHCSLKDVKTQQNVQHLTDHFEKLIAEPISVPETSPLSSPKPDSSCCMNNVIPPRPPKPSKLRDRCCYENFKLPLQVQRDFPKELIVDEDLSPSTKVPVQTSSLVNADGNLDNTYDFPKFRNEENVVPPPSSCGRQRRHAYTNAAPGRFNNKDLIFNYEYRPSLLNSDALVKESDCNTSPSPSDIGAYANLPTSPTLSTSFQNEVPPVVNRELKPKRVMNSEERGSFSFLTLQPPPISRSRMKANKRSFRKARSPTLSPNLNMPPVPNRFRAQPEVSPASDDELSNSSGSRHNSSTDDQARQVFSSVSKKDEIQYLDLDLDSEPSPSPKSPERMSASTVYKKVDFVKTKAFNEMRQNVEETYRKSQ